jgi:exosortase
MGPFGWSGRRSVAVLLVLMLLAAARWGLRDVLWAIHDNWTHIYGDFAHGYLVLAMCSWLVVRDFRLQPYSPEAPWWPALPMLGVMVLALAMLLAWDIQSLSQALVPAIATAVVAAVAGLGVARRLIWPVVLLYTAIPVWWLLNAPLQQLTAAVANGLVQLTGVPAFVEGNTFNLPAGVVQVASGCSGLNYLVVSLALGLFQGLLYLRTWKSRIKVLVAAVVVALLSNWLRVYTLILVGYATDMRHYLIRVDHLTFGWVLFMVCFWPVLRLGARLANKEGDEPSPARFSTQPVATSLRPMLIAGLAAAALLLVPGLAGLLLD